MRNARGEETGHPMEGRGRRIFGHGEIRYVVLAQLANSPAHGYELIKAIAERLNGAYAPSPGLIYPTLTQLEELGYINAQTQSDDKKSYAITEEGRKFLDAGRGRLEQILERMAHVAECHRKTTAPEIGVAMERLKSALRQKSWVGELNPDQIVTVAAVIERAAKEIEEL